MSNAKYFLLGAGTAESRESCTPSADLPWEMQTWNWLCVTHRMTSEHFTSSNEEAQEELGAGAPTCPMLRGGHLQTSQEQQKLPSLCLRST